MIFHSTRIKILLIHRVFIFKHIPLDILVSRNPDSGNMETGIPERKPPLIGLINTHKESNECQAQSRFAGHKSALHL